MSGCVFRDRGIVRRGGSKGIDQRSRGIKFRSRDDQPRAAVGFPQARGKVGKHLRRTAAVGEIAAISGVQIQGNRVN
ncbi:MAG TPA: hypothetical protein VJK90_05920 [Acetobacteraceae bacterium]|jgi:hypothetical protein|nr:hypothetical protein [Acetobacteraceae bacterium]